MDTIQDLHYGPFIYLIYMLPTPDCSRILKAYHHQMRLMHFTDLKLNEISICNPLITTGQRHAISKYAPKKKKLPHFHPSSYTDRESSKKSSVFTNKGITFVEFRSQNKATERAKTQENVRAENPINHLQVFRNTLSSLHFYDLKRRHTSREKVGQKSLEVALRSQKQQRLMSGRLLRSEKRSLPLKLAGTRRYRADSAKRAVKTEMQWLQGWELEEANPEFPDCFSAIEFK